MVSVILQIGSIGFFIAMYAVEDQLPSVPTLYHTFNQVYINGVVYLCCFVLIVGQILLHIAYNFLFSTTS